MISSDLIVERSDDRIALFARWLRHDSDLVFVAYRLRLHYRSRLPIFASLGVLSSVDAVLYASDIKTNIKYSARHDGAGLCRGADVIENQ